MVKSMIFHSTLLESLWAEVLNIVAYILNRITTKATVKTRYELWTGKESSLKHLYVWEFLAETRPYRPNEKKLDLKTMSCFFIRYLERSGRYKFYDP